MSDLDAKFKTAAEDVTKLSEAPDNSVKLKLYALFKQASEGDVKGDKPGMFDFVAGAKYNAWAELAGTDSDTAKQKYIDLVEALKAKE
ncbi:acyl-CoA-binding protein [Chitinimonas sp. BJYL2]|uniref:acyl-CoA-binding protein n=1 Tax=Chitinimonas sp. BJYL2 TaxID=2976696 RepID=UPI0022B44DD7|nr:acyl-CoA-binding protein [Chitinimonas sp. BJYL2]